MTYPRSLGVFDGEKKQFTAEAWEEEDGRCHMLADFDVDVDGSGPSHGDPCFQPDTTYHLAGKPLNSDVHFFGVLPPDCILRVKPLVLGCRMRITYKGLSVFGFVGDVGPTRKVGEGSYIWAKTLGMNPSPINGGVDFAEVLYEWWPGIPGMIQGVPIPLQAYRHS